MGVDTQLLGNPVNKTAALVTGKGFSHEWQNKARPHVTTFTAQPYTRKPPNKTPDYSGVKFGRMVVVGLAQEFKKRWVVRCSCGLYELRSAKAITKEIESPEIGTAGNGMCNECLNLMVAQKKEAKQNFYRKHGCWPNESKGPEAKRIVEKFG